MLINAKKDLEYIRERYPEIIEQGDMEAMQEMKHKHTTMISLFNASELSRQLAEAIDFLNDNSSDSRLADLKRETLNNLDALKDRIDKMMQEADMEGKSDGEGV
ncbi:MAG: hypothetical protein ACFCUM_19315 [Bacteroidales bacterium]